MQLPAVRQAESRAAQVAQKVVGEVVGTEKRESPANPGPILRSLYGMPGNIPGITVTHETALCYGAIYSCVRIIAETVSMLEWKLYQKKDGKKVEATWHPLYDCLMNTWNDEQNAMEGTEMLFGHASLRGNGFAQRIYNGAGQTIQLWPLHPAFMIIHRDQKTRKLVYVYTDPVTGVRYNFDKTEILHLRGLMSDGVWGMSPVALLRAAIETGLAQDKTRALFFANGIRPSGVFQHPEEMSEEAYKRLKEDLHENNMGVDGYFRPLILEEGMSWNQMSLTQEDAQAVENAKYTRREVLGAYRMPPHVTGDLDNATFSNIEQQSLEFALYCIGPWCSRGAKAMNHTLLSQAERDAGYFIKADVKPLLKGDYFTRAQANAIYRQNGVLNVDEIREEEDLGEPLPNGEGKIYQAQMNLAQGGGDMVDPQGKVGGGKPNQQQQPGHESDDDEADDEPSPQSKSKKALSKSKSKKRSAGDFKLVIRDAVERFTSREVKMLEQRMKKGELRSDAYRDISPALADYLRPVCMSLDSDAEKMGGLARAIAYRYESIARETFSPEQGFIESRNSPEAIDKLVETIVADLDCFLLLDGDKNDG
jgi:HK97 family phage portal protein